MTQSIISDRTTDNRDEDLTDEHMDRICLAVFRIHGPMTIEDHHHLKENVAAAVATSTKTWSAETKGAVVQYVNTLPSRKRTLLKHWLSGKNPMQIGKAMRVNYKVVAAGLAEIYLDLQRRFEQPVIPAQSPTDTSGTGCPAPRPAE